MFRICLSVGSMRGPRSSLSQDPLQKELPESSEVADVKNKEPVIAEEREGPAGEDLVKETEGQKKGRGLGLSQEGFGDLAF